MTDHDTFPTTLLPMDQMPPVRSQHDLQRTWSLLLSPLGFASPQLWMLALKDDRIVLPVNITDLPLEPVPSDLELFQSVIARTCPTDGGRHEVALLFARPGAGPRTAGDRAWARALADLSPTRPVHLANDHEVTVVAPDDLGATG
ncbi:hypothetical protein [Lapillicoccus jejuensis]|uniref:Uncharacterized protein n=1 Tax=Lapillicoccus jejuensis TaxID=402171 RepID=A0A542DV90_9MICO|nr:hypothetical protein [Lapillicoccus jejuensis]TQJ07012.1 hypothetical protein FB458_0058 [Lapillicoccus jejuensis]